jgi:broad specificity phosphatase PhoE
VPGLLLIRHAQSVWNAEGRWQGWADPPLSAAGERQTRLSAARLRAVLAADGLASDGLASDGLAADGLASDGPVFEGPVFEGPAFEGPAFDVIVSSDLARARRTAQLMAEVLQVAGPHWIEPGLREYNVGEWSGRTLQQIESRWPGDTARFAADAHFAPPGGESRTHFDSRVAAAGRQVATQAAAAELGRMLVVAHGGVVRALARAAGQVEYRVGHLAGYRGWYVPAGLCPVHPVDLLEGLDEAAEADAGEGAVRPIR